MRIIKKCPHSDSFQSEGINYSFCYFRECETPSSLNYQSTICICYSYFNREKQSLSNFREFFKIRVGGKKSDRKKPVVVQFHHTANEEDVLRETNALMYQKKQQMKKEQNKQNTL